MSDPIFRNAGLSESQKSDVINRLQGDIEKMKAQYLLKSANNPILQKYGDKDQGLRKNYTTLSSTGTNIEEKFKNIINHDLPENNTDDDDFYRKGNELKSSSSKKDTNKNNKVQTEEDLDVEKDNLSEFDMNDYEDEDGEYNSKRKQAQAQVVKEEKEKKTSSSNYAPANSSTSKYANNQFNEKDHLAMENKQSFDPKYFSNTKPQGLSYGQEAEDNEEHMLQERNRDGVEQYENYGVEEEGQYNYNQHGNNYDDRENQEQFRQTNQKPNIYNREEEMEMDNYEHEEQEMGERQNYNNMDEGRNYDRYYEMDGDVDGEMETHQRNPQDYNSQDEYKDYEDRAYAYNNNYRETEEEQPNNMENVYLNENRQQATLKSKNNNKEKGDYSIFDKAKEDLLKVKQEMDEMDKYDYRNFSNKNTLSESIKKDTIQQAGNLASDDEDVPKNFEEEYSVRNGERDERNYGKEPLHQSLQNNKGYNFKNPLHQTSYEKMLSEKYGNEGIGEGTSLHNYNTQQPNKKLFLNQEGIGSSVGKGSKKPPVPYSGSNAQNYASSKYNERKEKRTNSIGRNASTSKEREKKSTPYFSNLSSQYNPKYREKSNEKFNRIKSELEMKMREECSFTPKISDFASNKYEGKTESKDEKYKRLSTPKIVEVQKRQKEKELQEATKVTSDCTFQPNASKINKKNYSSTDLQNETIQNRLLRLGEALKEKKEKMMRENQENIAMEYSFTPEINETSKFLAQKYENGPLHERYNDVMKIKKENQQRLRMQLEKQNATNHKPEINPKSKEIATRKNNANDNSFVENPGERLYREGIKNKKRDSEGYDHALDNCTFSPQLYYSGIQPGGNINDFLERQQIYNEIIKERKERKLSKSTDKVESLFNPQINMTSDILMKADHNRANETKEEKINRLCNKDAEKLQNRKEQLENFYYAQYDFKPKINEISRNVGRNSSVTDLANKKESKKSKQYRSEKINKESEGCTFTPQTNKGKFNNIQSNYKRDENIGNRIQEEVRYKQEKMDEKKQFLEDNETKNFNFKPEINKKVPNFENKEPIMMKGYARYLEQMEKAKKAKREKEERIKEVFVTGENWSKDNIITMPKPFNLSYQHGNKKQKEEEKQKKKNEYEMKECTFAPKTNESKNKEIIKMILKE